MFRDCGNVCLWKSSLFNPSWEVFLWGVSGLAMKVGGGVEVKPKISMVVTLSYGRQTEKLTSSFLLNLSWIENSRCDSESFHETLFCRIITQCISWSSHGLCQTYLLGVRLRNASGIVCFRVMDLHLRTCWPSSRGLLLNKHPYWRPTACSWNILQRMLAEIMNQLVCKTDHWGYMIFQMRIFHTSERIVQRWLTGIEAFRVSTWVNSSVCQGTTTLLRFVEIHEKIRPWRIRVFP